MVSVCGLTLLPPGKCSYDSDAGSIRIWGSTDAITDITAAGGWTILNCEPDALVQDIRLVCQDGEACSHFWASIGPVGKIVRLPEDVWRLLSIHMLPTHHHL